MRANAQSAPIKAALLFERDSFREPLRAALAAAGATVRHEFRISQFEAGDLDTLDAGVLLVNLEPVLTSRPELLEALVQGRFSGAIVFNDGDATAQLADADMARWARHLASKIRGGTGLPPPPHEAPKTPLEPLSTDLQHDEFELWLLGASIGGPEAVRVFLGELNEDVPFAFVLAQHIGEEFIDLMTGQLNQVSRLPVRCAHNDDLLKPGTVLVVPPKHQLTISKQNRVHLEPLPERSNFSPCIDQVFIDAVERFGAAAHAIIFSGMSRDGVSGSELILERGGEVWVQTPETCVVSSMVEGALKTGKVHFTGTPAELAHRLNARAAQYAARGMNA